MEVTTSTLGCMQLQHPLADSLLSLNHSNITECCDVKLGRSSVLCTTSVKHKLCIMSLFPASVQALHETLASSHQYIRLDHNAMAWCCSNGMTMFTKPGWTICYGWIPACCCQRRGQQGWWPLWPPPHMHQFLATSCTPATPHRASTNTNPNWLGQNLVTAKPRLYQKGQKPELTTPSMQQRPRLSHKQQ